MRLASRGYRTIEAADNQTALRRVESARPSMVIVGCSADGMLEASATPLDLVRLLQRHHPGIPVLFFVGGSSEALAINALRAGVADYIKQPDFDELIDAVTRRLEFPAGQPATEEEPFEGPLIAGASLALARTRQYLRKVAATDCTVLITGETGTGKELAAQAIHCNSARRTKPFVTINCAAIPDELVESELFGFERGAFTGAHAFNSGKLTVAEGGTVFLDEIGELNPYAQAKMLRVIENKEVQRLGGKQNRPLDIRVIAATNQDLEGPAQVNKFRRDLYFRLKVAHIRLPPLRERCEDIPVLAEVFLRELNRRMRRAVEGLSGEVMDLLMRHTWPGNVRELKNLIEALLVAVSEGWIVRQDLPESFTLLAVGGEHVLRDERSIVLRALQTTRWNKSKAAQRLNWSRMTLYRKMAKYEIVSHIGKSKSGRLAASG
jgi:DNA-binding NtrC family response regulator